MIVLLGITQVSGEMLQNEVSHRYVCVNESANGDLAPFGGQAKAAKPTETALVSQSGFGRRSPVPRSPTKSLSLQCWTIVPR